MSKTSRAKQAGRRLGETINEMAHLMYQKNTSKNFWEGLFEILNNNSICQKCMKRTYCDSYSLNVLECGGYAIG